MRRGIEVQAEGKRLRTYFVRAFVDLLLCEQLTHGARFLYLLLQRYHDIGRGRDPFTSLATLSREMGVGVTKIKALVVELAEKGWLGVERRNGRTNRYRLLDGPAEPSRIPTGSETDRGGFRLGPSRNPARTEPESDYDSERGSQKEGVENTPAAGDDGEPWFREAWGLPEDVKYHRTAIALEAVDRFRAFRSSPVYLPYPPGRQELIVFHKHRCSQVIVSQKVTPETFKLCVERHENAEIHGKPQYGQSWPNFCAKLAGLVGYVAKVRKPEDEEGFGFETAE